MNFMTHFYDFVLDVDLAGIEQLTRQITFAVDH